MIVGYTVRIDPAAVGYMETVIVQATLESHNDETLDAFGKALKEIPEVLEAYLISGDYDYHIRIAVRDTRDYERLLRERFYRIPGIRHSKSSLCYADSSRVLRHLYPCLNHRVRKNGNDDVLRTTHNQRTRHRHSNLVFRPDAAIGQCRKFPLHGPMYRCTRAVRVVK